MLVGHVAPPAVRRVPKPRVLGIGVGLGVVVDVEHGPAEPPIPSRQPPDTSGPRLAFCQSPLADFNGREVYSSAFSVPR